MQGCLGLNLHCCSLQTTQGEDIGQYAGLAFHMPAVCGTEVRWHCSLHLERGVPHPLDVVWGPALRGSRGKQLICCTTFPVTSC